MNTVAELTISTDDSFISTLNQEMRDLIVADGSPRFIDLKQADIAGFMREYKYPVGSWPFFVSRQIVEQQFEEIAGSIPTILSRAIRARFGTDGGAFQAYTSWPARLYELLQLYTPRREELICRFDAVVHRGRVKLLELNVGTSSGGWHLDWLLPEMDKSVQRYPTIAGRNLRKRQLYEDMLRITTSWIEARKPGALGNILVFNFMGIPEALMPLQASLNDVYQRVKPPRFAAGTASVFMDFSELSFTADSEVVFHGKIMDAVWLSFDDASFVPPGIYDKLNEAYLRGKLYFPDSPFHLVFGSKILFAVAHDCCAQHLLSPADMELILRYIPWTAKVQAAETLWQGSYYTVSDLLVKHKDIFIIKKADSCAGKHVCVGYYSEPTEWREAVVAAISEGGWVAQEFCPPARIVMDGSDGEAQVHQVLWGLFSLGGTYGGAFVRARPMGQIESGVLNSANGAVEFLVLEEAGER